ncbi:ABC transporter permease [Anaerocolumna cellulosilytica]|uniref:ABC transporter permease n=1 Tax=Anaerocolumna cellulosilytica TaxID=433286 RepID=A0A6S6QXK2_9FIRM|nr:ABC transporter permease [Anaerocolumna cellulosilytica]MBB5195401.1 simple sugar transport system permease protein [Anaerocolumna cellulosilytica]BCJ95933.1 ABC transporter permease [Anaerocolumna cellulosilytica]
MNDILALLVTPAFFYAILRVTTPILFAALGNVISSKAGVSNIAMEGTMLTASLAGVLASAYSKSALIGLIAALLVGVLFSAFMAYLSLYLGTKVIMAGIALNLFASSFTVYILYMFTGQKGNSASLASKQIPSVKLPLIDKIPVIGEIFSGHNILVYVALLSVAAIYIMLNKTKLGTHIKAVGENPAAAASVGIKVRRVQFTALCLSGLLAGFGGAYMSMGYLSMFTRDMIAGRGWIAIAASAMGRSMVIPTTITSFLFGIFSAIGNVLQLQNIPSELITTLPYVAVFIGIVVYSVRKSRGGRS